MDKPKIQKVNQLDQVFSLSVVADIIVKCRSWCIYNDYY